MDDDTGAVALAMSQAVPGTCKLAYVDLSHNQIDARAAIDMLTEVSTAATVAPHVYTPCLDHMIISDHFMFIKPEQLLTSSRSLMVF